MGRCPLIRGGLWGGLIRGGKRTLLWRDGGTLYRGVVEAIRGGMRRPYQGGNEGTYQEGGWRNTLIMEEIG